MRQKVNFSSVFIKLFDLNKFESKSEIDINNRNNVFIIEQI